MKNLISGMMYGKSNKANGLMALIVVSLIALGCTCGKGFEELTKKDSSGPSNSSSGTPTTGTPKREINYTKADASKKEIPSDAEMQDIVRTTMLDFNDAIKAADFTDFHSTVSKLWQRQTNPEKMKTSFQTFITGRTDISVISAMDATFTSPAKIEKRIGMNMLDVKGEYATSPIRTTFELQYVPEGKEWKLALIKVVAPIKK